MLNSPPETWHNLNNQLMHLRREFSEIGWDRDDALHASKVDEEIRRLETQARVLRMLREAAFGSMPDAGPAAPG